MLTDPITRWEAQPLADADLNYLLRLIFEPAPLEAVQAA